MRTPSPLGSTPCSSPHAWRDSETSCHCGPLICPFGTFVEIGDAVHGLLLDATLTVGERVRVRVADIDADKHRVGLTIE
jgi:hypothetical protein